MEKPPSRGTRDGWSYNATRHHCRPLSSSLSPSFTTRRYDPISENYFATGHVVSRWGKAALKTRSAVTNLAEVRFVAHRPVSRIF